MSKKKKDNTRPWEKWNLTDFIKQQDNALDLERIMNEVKPFVLTGDALIEMNFRNLAQALKNEIDDLREELKNGSNAG